MNGRRPPAAAGSEPWWVTVRLAAAVFARQVLLRPLRIGTLILLAAAVVGVVAGARGWWIILGVVLFQLAGSSLIVLWTDSERGGPGDGPATPWRQARGRDAGRPPDPPEPPDPEVPGQRTPRED